MWQHLTGLLKCLKDGTCISVCGSSVGEQSALTTAWTWFMWQGWSTTGHQKPLDLKDFRFWRSLHRNKKCAKVCELLGFCRAGWGSEKPTLTPNSHWQLNSSKKSLFKGHEAQELSHNQVMAFRGKYWTAESSIEHNYFPSDRFD